MRLSEAVDELLIATRVAGRSERTVQDYAEKTARLVDFLDDKSIDGDQHINTQSGDDTK